MLYLLKLAHRLSIILYSNKITRRISKVRVTNHKSLLKLPATARLESSFQLRVQRVGDQDFW